MFLGAFEISSHVGLSLGCLGSKYLNCHLLPPRRGHRGKLELEEELKLKPRPSDVGYGCPKQHLTCCAKLCPHEFMKKERLLNRGPTYMHEQTTLTIRSVSSDR